MKALITGASGGIGEAIARRFLAAGYDVVGIDVAAAKIDDPRYTHYQTSVLGDLPEIADVGVIVTAAGVQSAGEDAIDVNLKASCASWRNTPSTPRSAPS